MVPLSPPLHLSHPHDGQDWGGYNLLEPAAVKPVPAPDGTLVVQVLSTLNLQHNHLLISSSRWWQSKEVLVVDEEDEDEIKVHTDDPERPRQSSDVAGASPQPHPHLSCSLLN